MVLRTGFSIRTKLLLVALLLLLIPWMSYIYVRDMKAFLLSGQEDALSLTARAIATVLHDRPEMFSDDHETLSPQSKENDIYVTPLPNYININGELSDWGEQAKQTKRFEITPSVDDVSNTQNIFSVNNVLGYRGNFIYAMFEVNDDTVLFRQKSFLRVDAADHIRLTLQQSDLEPLRYTLISKQPGRMSAYLMDKDWQYPVTGEPNYDLAAELALTESGYNAELRIPRFMLTSDTRIGLTVVDVDNANTYDIEATLSTTPQTDTDDLSRLLVQSTEIAKILKGLDRADNTRIWIFDKDKEFRNVVGNISDTNDQLNTNPAANKTGWEYVWGTSRYYFRSTMRKIFSYILKQPNANLNDEGQSTKERNDQIIDDALQGKISTQRRPSIDNLGTILISAHPIYLGDSIAGTVIVEQSTNQVLKSQQESLENVISITVFILLAVLSSLVIFSSRLTLRIRRLRNATDNAIDRDGRIVTQKLPAEAKSGDEIGDLSRSVSNMLGRLSQYTSYLKGLPDTLAHEISNPLNVVNSSLHNLSQELPSSAQSKYMDRAQNGINRIGLILRNLTEAANLEQAMQSEGREKIDLAELIEGYADGYSFSNPDQKFEVIIHAKPLIVEVAPDYIAQALDKLVDNAIDHAKKGTLIVFNVSKQAAGMAQVSVINQGSLLPEGMAERIFEPLVSLGRKDAQKISLGMGLYIVKLISSFHGGDVMAKNLPDSKGVIVSISLPLYFSNRNANNRKDDSSTNN